VATGAGSVVTVDQKNCLPRLLRWASLIVFDYLPLAKAGKAYEKYRKSVSSPAKLSVEVESTFKGSKVNAIALF
jgi:hypothetical protein